METPQACIFDLDGVIVHTSQFHYQAWKALADSLSISFNKEDNEMLKGVSREDSLRKILAIDNRQLDEETFQRLLDEKNEHYLSLVAQLQPSDIEIGIYPFLKALTSQDIAIAIGSSSKNAKRILAKLDLIELFDAVVDGTDVTRSKPDPEVFVKAAKALDVEADRCVVFEDASHGIDAAQQINMATIGVGTSDALNKADYVLQSFEDLTPDQLWATI